MLNPNPSPSSTSSSKRRRSRREREKRIFSPTNKKSPITGKDRSHVKVNLELDTLLDWLSFGPLVIMIIIDNYIKLFPHADWMPECCHYDDVAKFFLLDLLCLVPIIHSINRNLNVGDSILSTVLTSVYSIGLGVNQAVNAIDSSAKRLAIESGRSYVQVTGPEMEEAIFFWDEIAGHLIAYMAFFCMQLRWMNLVIYNRKVYISVRSNSWNVIRAIFTGFATGIIAIEAQTAEVGIFASLFLILFIQLHAGDKKSDNFVRFFYIVAIFNLVCFSLWHFNYGSFIEPSHLKEAGWSMKQVVSFGALGGRGPDVLEASGNKRTTYQSENAPAEILAGITSHEMQQQYEALWVQLALIVNEASAGNSTTLIDDARRMLGL